MRAATALAKVHLPDLGWAAAVSLACGAIFLASPVGQVGDSHFTLMLADQLLSEGRFDLAPRFAKGLDPALVAGDGLPYHTERVGPHVYDRLPPGAAVFSAPFVPILEALGVRFARDDGGYDAEAEARGQALLAAFLAALSAGIFYALARTLLTRPASVLLSLGAALGTPVWSTASRAVWSHTWALVFASLGVTLLLRGLARSESVRPALVASLFCAACVVRPAFVVPLAAVGVLLLRRSPRSLAAYALATTAWLSMIVTYARVLFGTWAPPSFVPAFLSPRETPVALLGLLVSPSRGVLLYVPVVLFIAYASVRYPPREELRPLRGLAAGVVAAHTLLLSTSPLWWSGHCYGPRSMTDLVPWLLLLAVLAVDGRSRAHAPGLARWSVVERVAGGGLLAASIGIHARGALAVETQEWNSRPRSVDVATERLWDWRQPQALAGWVYYPEGEPPLDAGQVVDLRTPDSERFVGRGWSRAEAHQRWALGPAAELGFAIDPGRDLVLRLEAEPFLALGRVEAQRVRFELNGRPIGEWRLPYGGVRTSSLRLPATALARRNRLRLHLPDAAVPSATGSSHDRRRLALAARTLRLELLPELPRGRALSFADDGARDYRGRGWSEPEARHLWTEGPEAELWFAARDHGPAVLRIALTPFVVPGHRDRQRLRIDLNGWTAADLELTDSAPRRLSILLPAGALARDNLLRLHLPDAQAGSPTGPALDPRPLGVAVESLRLDDLPTLPRDHGLDPQDTGDEPFLLDGWSREDASRPSPIWALGPRARVAFALEAPRARVLTLDVEPFAAPGLERQRLDLALNGARLTSLDLHARDEYPVALPPGLLARHNVLSFDLPDARSPAALGLGADPRRLGVIVRSVRLE